MREEGRGKHTLLCVIHQNNVLAWKLLTVRLGDRSVLYQRTGLFPGGDPSSCHCWKSINVSVAAYDHCPREAWCWTPPRQRWGHCSARLRHSGEAVRQPRPPCLWIQSFDSITVPTAQGEAGPASPTVLGHLLALGGIPNAVHHCHWQIHTFPASLLYQSAPLAYTDRV